MSTRLQRRRAQLEDELSRRGLAHTLSLARYVLHIETVRLIEAHAAGRCLDVGSGRGPYQEALRTRCESVTTVDIEDRSGKVDLIADIQKMDLLESLSFDTVVCTQVLEHVPHPGSAVIEMARILRPGGKLILSVPHLSAIHEAPKDFYRYTRWGLETLCTDADLDVAEIRAAGGLLAFLGHGASYLSMSTLGVLPLLRWPTWGVNYALLVRGLGFLDSLLGMRGTYPCNWVLLAQRISSDLTD